MDYDPRQEHYAQENRQKNSPQQSNREYQPPGQKHRHGKQKPVYNVGHPLGTSSMHLAPNIAGALSYAGWWITGLIFLLGERRNHFVHFHAIQSILTFLLVSVVWAVLRFIFALPVIGAIGWFLGPILAFLLFLLWAGLIVLALLGKEVRLPITGPIAARLSGIEPKIHSANHKT